MTRRATLPPAPPMGSSPNQANYNNAMGGGHSTDVGSLSGSGSFYGTFDQSGNVYQWNDLDGTAGSGRGLRGCDSYSVSFSNRPYREPWLEYGWWGFRLASPV